MPEYAFVLEDSLGHGTHALNLRRSFEGVDGITVIDIKNRPPDGLAALPGLRNWSLRASREARRSLRRRLAAGPLDGIFIHTQVASLLSVHHMRQVPTVISMDATPANLDDQGEAYGHRRGPAAAERIKWLVNRRALLAARRLVTWSAWAKRSLIADYGISEERVEVIHPGVDLRLFRPAARKPARRPRLLFVGADFERKGGPELLRALDLLPAAVEVDVVTRMPVAPRPGLRVHLDVAPRSPELVRLYQRADIFVLPTRGECFAQVIPEAMACGLPVVATPVAAIPEMVEPEHNGLLVPPRSPEALAAALARLAADPLLRSRFGAASLALARSQHDAGFNAGRLLSLMDGLRKGLQPALV